MRRAFLWGSNGNGRYSELRYAKDDASALAATLRQSRYAFDAEVHEDTSDPFDVFRALKAAGAKCKADDIFIAHFSGHGQIIGSRLYLVLDHSDPDNPATLFSSAWLIEAMTECRARHRLLILDCCHAGAATGVKGQSVPALELLPELTATQQILYASGKLEEARELAELGGSFLTRTLCRILGSESESRMSLSQVATLLQAEASQFNLQQQSAATRVPIPFVSGVRLGEFYFDGADPAADVPELPPPLPSQDVVSQRLESIRTRMITALDPWTLAQLRDEAHAIFRRIEATASVEHVVEAQDLERRIAQALQHASPLDQEMELRVPMPQPLLSVAGWVVLILALILLLALVLIFVVR